MITWTKLNDQELATLPNGTKLRIKQEDQGVYSMGKVMALSVLTTEKGWKWLDSAWFQTDGGYDTYKEKGKTLYGSPGAAKDAVKTTAEYLYAEQAA